MQIVTERGYMLIEENSVYWGFPWGAAVQETWVTQVWFWFKKIPSNRKWKPAPGFLPGKFQGQRNLAGYSPWGHKQSDITEHTHACKHTHTECVPVGILMLLKMLYWQLFWKCEMISVISVYKCARKFRVSIASPNTGKG